MCRRGRAGVVLREAVRGGPEGCDGRGPFYLAAAGPFLRVSLQRFPSLPPEIRNHCSIWADSGEILASIPKSGPEIKNHCSIWADSEENLAAIPKSGPEIKNHCSIWADSEENLASIPKSGPEIKNHCSRGLVAVCRRNHSSLPQQRLESDTDIVVATTAAGGPFSFAATKIRIGHGQRCRDDCCRRNHSTLRQRRDAANHNVFLIPQD